VNPAGTLAVHPAEEPKLTIPTCTILPFTVSVMGPPESPYYSNKISENNLLLYCYQHKYEVVDEHTLQEPLPPTVLTQTMSLVMMLP